MGKIRIRKCRHQRSIIPTRYPIGFDTLTGHVKGTRYGASSTVFSAFAPLRSQGLGSLNSRIRERFDGVLRWILKAWRQFSPYPFKRHPLFKKFWGLQVWGSHICHTSNSFFMASLGFHSLSPWTRRLFPKISHPQEEQEGGNERITTTNYHVLWWFFWGFFLLSYLRLARASLYKRMESIIIMIILRMVKMAGLWGEGWYLNWQCMCGCWNY